MSSDSHPRPSSGAVLRIPLRNWTSDRDRNAPPSVQTLAGTSKVTTAARTLSATPIPASTTPMSPTSSAPTSSAAPSSPAPRSSAHCTAPKAFTAPDASLRRRNPPRAVKEATKSTAAAQAARAAPLSCKAKPVLPSSPALRSSADGTAPKASTAPSAPTSSDASLRRKNTSRAATSDYAKTTEARPGCSGGKIGLSTDKGIHESNDQEKHVSDILERDLKSKSVVEQNHSSIAKQKLHKVIVLNEKLRLREIERARGNFLRVVQEIDAGHASSVLSILDEAMSSSAHESNYQEKHVSDTLERDLKSKSVVEQNHSSIAKQKLHKVIVLNEKERLREIERARGNFLRVVQEIDAGHASSVLSILDEAMSSSVVAVVCNDEMLGHVPPNRSHHEQPERYSRIMEKLRDEKILDRCALFEAEPATVEILHDLDVHTLKYLTYVNALSSTLDEDVDSKHFPDNEDMYISKGTSKAAFLAAGAAIKACQLVLAGPFMSSFAIVRPPGHHVHKDGPPSGFSFINNIAAAARHALKKHLLERILIVDWDVHHGDGTQNIFFEDKRVLFFSIHRFGNKFFPGTGKLKDIGAGSAAGYNINFCCNQKAGDPDYVAVWNDILLPVADEFDPELILISSGFDAAPRDIGGCSVTAEGFAFLLQKLTKRPIVMVLEGGYKHPTNSSSAAACLRVLLGDQVNAFNSSKPPLASTKDMIQKTREALMQYWKCFR